MTTTTRMAPGMPPSAGLTACATSEARSWGFSGSGAAVAAASVAGGGLRPVGEGEGAGAGARLAARLPHCSPGSVSSVGASLTQRLSQEPAHDQFNLS
jgi:hypothetical protein